jgi:hypothetical protein
MFYVYVYRDPRPTKNMQPVYVGKGTGDRDLSHWSRGSHNKPLQDFLSHLRQRGLTPVCERVFETPDETAAFAKELELIALYGRRDLKRGTLFNLTDGGEGVAGMVKTPEQKAADGRFTKEHWQQPEYRAKVIAAQKAVQGTEEARAMKSENSKTTWADTEVRTKRAEGIKRGRSTAESRSKTSRQSKAQWDDPEYAARQTLNNQEIANRAEVKAAKAAAAKALWADPAWREKMLAARKARKSNKLVDPAPIPGV